MKEIFDLISALFTFIVKSIADLWEIWVIMLAFSIVFLALISMVEIRGEHDVRPWFFFVPAIIFLVGFWFSLFSLIYNYVN